MTLTIQAEFVNGILRPLAPLHLLEGERVEVTISPIHSVTPPNSEVDIIQQIQACKTYIEWLEVMKLLPPDDGGYDISKALPDNRSWSDGCSTPPSEDTKS
jgi:predicted DNA-binding antitoxin AbrB/MazE fold protein